MRLLSFRKIKISSVRDAFFAFVVRFHTWRDIPRNDRMRFLHNRARSDGAEGVKFAWKKKYRGAWLRNALCFWRYNSFGDYPLSRYDATRRGYRRSACSSRENTRRAEMRDKKV